MEAKRLLESQATEFLAMDGGCNGRGGVPESKNIPATAAFGDAAITDERKSMLPGRMAGRRRCDARRGRGFAAAHAGVAVARMPVARRAGLAALHDRGDLFLVDGFVLQQRR